MDNHNNISPVDDRDSAGNNQAETKDAGMDDPKLKPLWIEVKWLRHRLEAMTKRNSRDRGRTHALISEERDNRIKRTTRLTERVTELESAANSDAHT